MAFVAGPAVAASGPLPSVQDVSGNNPPTPMYSHVRVTGAGTLTFDTGHVFTTVAAQDSVYAIPVGARSVVIGGGTPAVQYGQMI